ncbi:hypothetical protein [Erwinia endophytica]|uniref:hypothetical protein n=1 Tax=Erwinia endophytica TaxID=1563158 RepID=UPI00186BA706|nr:hypothetical protein [Erwinia endophytica]
MPKNKLTYYGHRFVFHEDIINTPQTFISMLERKNFGKVLIRVACDQPIRRTG